MGSVKLKCENTGMVFDFSLPLPYGIQRQLDGGHLLDVTDAEPAPVVPIGGTVARPRGNASHQAWIDYAATQGMDRAEAATLTRDQLRGRFTQPVFDPDSPPDLEAA